MARNDDEFDLDDDATMEIDDSGFDDDMTVELDDDEDFSLTDSEPDDDDSGSFMEDDEDDFGAPAGTVMIPVEESPIIYTWFLLMTFGLFGAALFIQLNWLKEYCDPQEFLGGLWPF